MWSRIRKNIGLTPPQILAPISTNPELPFPPNTQPIGIPKVGINPPRDGRIGIHPPIFHPGQPPRYNPQPIQPYPFKPIHPGQDGGGGWNPWEHAGFSNEEDERKFFENNSKPINKSIINPQPTPYLRGVAEPQLQETQQNNFPLIKQTLSQPSPINNESEQLKPSAQNINQPITNTSMGKK